MTISTVLSKRINLFPDGDIYVLAVPHDGEFYSFYLMHNKMQSVLKMFGSLAAKIPDEETLLCLAVEGWNEYREEYLAMLENEYNAE